MLPGGEGEESKKKEKSRWEFPWPKSHATEALRMLGSTLLCGRQPRPREAARSWEAAKKFRKELQCLMALRKASNKNKHSRERCKSGTESKSGHLVPPCCLAQCLIRQHLLNE